MFAFNPPKPGDKLDEHHENLTKAGYKHQFVQGEHNDANLYWRGNHNVSILTDRKTGKISHVGMGRKKD